MMKFPIPREITERLTKFLPYLELEAISGVPWMENKRVKNTVVKRQAKQ